MFRRIGSILAIAALSLMAAVVPAQAQTQEGKALTNGQLATACTACKGAPACNTPRINGSVGDVMAWLNGARTPEVLAWSTSAPASAARRAPVYTTYDSLVQGKRDSWLLFLADSQDYTKAKIRNWVTDVWGPAVGGSNGEAILLAGTLGATNLQHALGGTVRSTGAVSALDLTYPYLAPDNTADWLVVAANCQ